MFFHSNRDFPLENVRYSCEIFIKRCAIRVTIVVYREANKMGNARGVLRAHRARSKIKHTYNKYILSMFSHTNTPNSSEHKQPLMQP